MRFACIKKMRIGIWKQWKTPENSCNNLMKLGVKRSNAIDGVLAEKDTACSLTNKYFARLGYEGFVKYYYLKTEHQPKIF